MKTSLEKPPSIANETIVNLNRQLELAESTYEKMMLSSKSQRQDINSNSQYFSVNNARCKSEDVEGNLRIPVHAM